LVLTTLGGAHGFGSIKKKEGRVHERYPQPRGGGFTKPPENWGKKNCKYENVRVGDWGGGPSEKLWGYASSPCTCKAVRLESGRKQRAAREG